MTRSTFSSTRLAGVLAIAAAVGMTVPAMAQTTTTPAAPMTTPKTPAASAPMGTTATTPMGTTATTPMGTTATTNKTRPTGMETTSGDRASKIIGAGVMNDSKDSIGSVDDLIITPDEKVPTAILSVGGFLGIGTKYVAVPFNDLKMTKDGVMMPGATKDSLKALPEFKYDHD